MRRIHGVLAVPGARLAYEVTGDGPAVVLVHGFGLDMRMWDPQVRYLASQFQVVRYDLRGFGGSRAFDPDVGYTHPGDLVALLDHLGLGQVALAGLSFGGAVVLDATVAFPARVRGIALLGAGLEGVPWDPGSAPGVARKLAAIVARYPGQRWAGRDPHEPAAPRPIDVLETLAMPVLVVVGEHDVPGFREMSAVLARRIPGARYHIVPGAGHMVSMERPDVVNDLLSQFLAGLPPSPAAGRLTCQ